MELIDAILYINLKQGSLSSGWNPDGDHRTDRRQHLCHQFQAFPPGVGQRLHRVEAIRCEPGALGCGRSHIKALELAWLHSEWTWVMKLEDDFTFCSGSQAAALALRRLMTHDESMDVAVLAFNPLCAELIPTGNGNVHRVVRSQTTSGYVIRHGYIPTLLNNFREAMDRMERAGRSTERDCIDMARLLSPMHKRKQHTGHPNWSTLQERDTETP